MERFTAGVDKFVPWFIDVLLSNFKK